MAKGNLFLGYGRGKVGDVVFSRQAGEQVARARNRSPRNPRTPLQLLQRVVLKTSSTAFSMMQDICNHSYQGYEGVTVNQSQFTKLNVAKLRARLADEINSGDDDRILTSSEANFASRDVTMPPFNSYIVSQGTIPTPVFDLYPSSSSETTTAVNLGLGDAYLDGETNAITYQQLIDRLGLQVGDQLTFMVLAIDDTEDATQSVFNTFAYARLVLEPADGDLTHNVFDTAYWSERNHNLTLAHPYSAESAAQVLGVSFSSSGIAGDKGQQHSIAAGAVIVSRYNGSVWERSSASLVLRPDTTEHPWHLAWEHSDMYLGDAVQSYLDGVNSSLYLNQADT